MPLPPSLIPCPVCGAVLAADTLQAGDHLYWHEQTGTLGRFSSREPAAAALDRDRTWHHLYPPADDAATTRMPPVGATVRRRPPVPPPAVVHELQGADLLRAIAEELDRQDTAELHAVRGDEDERGGYLCPTCGGWGSCEPAGCSRI